MSYLPSSTAEGSSVPSASGSLSAVGAEVFEGLVVDAKFSWHLSEEQIAKCAGASTGDKLESKVLKVKGGTLWNIWLYPKGYDDANTGFVSCYLAFDPILNAEVSGIAECVAQFMIQANGFEDTSTHTFPKPHTRGFLHLGRSPSFAPGSEFTIEVQLTVLKTTKVQKSTETFDDWFKTMPYPEYRDVLEREGYDRIDAMQYLDDDELQRIGVTRAGHRRGILRAIAALKKEE